MAISGRPLATFSQPIAGKFPPRPAMNHMHSEAIIRPARPGDSDAIAALMLEDVSDQVRRITILGSPYLARFIADELAWNKNDEYVMCTVRERIVGSVRLENISTRPCISITSVWRRMCVGAGYGLAMMLDGLRRIRRTPQRILSIDVFSDTPRAEAWYRSLHMRSEQHSAVDSAATSLVEARWRSPLHHFWG